MPYAPNLAKLLTLERFGEADSNLYQGLSHANASGRSFGGQVMGQALYAAGLSAPAGREAHSMHGYFLRPGDSTQKMMFEVQPLFTGGSFANSRTLAYQDQGGGAAEPLMSMIASFQRPGQAPEFYEPYDIASLPEPESVPSLTDVYGYLAGNPVVDFVLKRPFEFRYIGGDVMQKVPQRTNRMQIWVRAVETLPDDTLLHKAALTFCSDYPLLEPAMSVFGLPWTTPGMKAASLDHAIWFHRDFRADDWLLYDLHCATSQGARALTRGRFFDTSGRLIATVMQEVLLRVPSGLVLDLDYDESDLRVVPDGGKNSQNSGESQ
ncbi:MAG: thioesterase family protein [Microbacteriaceae bacterium]|nr:thioesterase family protein [Microbacteriaceae bacterium]